jgi:D-cysteine desulfhydrase
MVSKLNMANLPTKIQKLERLSAELNKNIWIKRDDQTGSEFSGNKIRKLEYALSEAINFGCDTIITCGGIQSNHCRATAVASVMLGLKPVLLLRVSETPSIEGNYFIDKLLGADVRFCTPDEYRNSRGEIMNSIAKEYEKDGHKAYVIPEGASYGLGCMGYYNCMEEIVEQEKEMGVKFDTVVVATGSGGTYAGLHLANKINGYDKEVIGFAVCDNNEYFTDVVCSIGKDAIPFIGKPYVIKKEEIHFNDKYVGIGYALSTQEELSFINKIAKMEALILDPVYTGKAMKGLYEEIKSGNLQDSENILFIHTGGLFGLFPKQNDFIF